MRYLGLVLIPLLVVLIFAGPGCQRAQDEPEVQVEQAVEEAAEVPVLEKAPAAIEEVEVEEEVDVDPEEEAQKQADEHEVEKKIDELEM